MWCTDKRIACATTCAHNPLEGVREWVWRKSRGWEERRRKKKKRRDQQKGKGKKEKTKTPTTPFVPQAPQDKAQLGVLSSYGETIPPVRRHWQLGFERTDLSLNLQAWIHSSRLEIRGAIQIQDTLFEDMEGLDLEEKTWVWTSRRGFTVPVRRHWGLGFGRIDLDLNKTLTSRRGFTVPVRRHWGLEFGRKDLSWTPPGVDSQFQAWKHVLKA